MEKKKWILKNRKMKHIKGYIDFNDYEEIKDETPINKKTFYNIKAGDKIK